MTSLADEARALRRHPGGTCGVRRLLATLDPTEQADLLDAIAQREVSANTLSKAIRARDWFPISDQTITRHRQGTCTCE